MADEHSNTWMQIPGQVIGTGIGSFYGGPIGGMIGGQAGKGIGGGLGDLFGGNWNGLGQDVTGQLQQGLSMGQQGMNPMSMMQGLMGSAQQLPQGLFQSLFGLLGSK